MGHRYRQIATIYPPFWPALEHNLYWLGALAFVGTPFGMLLAYQLDKNLRGSRIYQSLLYVPVVIAPAIIGLIAELYLSPTQGLLNALFEDPQHGKLSTSGSEVWATSDAGQSWQKQ